MIEVKADKLEASFEALEQGDDGQVAALKDELAAWLDAELSEMEGDGRSRVLDMGGGDLVFPDYAREREVVTMLADARAAIAEDRYVQFMQAKFQGWGAVDDGVTS